MFFPSLVIEDDGDSKLLRCSGARRRSGDAAAAGEIGAISDRFEAEAEAPVSHPRRRYVIFIHPTPTTLLGRASQLLILSSE